MEQSINETINEEKKMSSFCETLMGVTGPLNDLRQNGDTALIICTDGVTLASRQCGLYPEALRMIYTKMQSDDKFAELILEASMVYSRNMNKPNNNSN